MRKLDILSHCGPHVKDDMGWVMTNINMKVLLTVQYICLPFGVNQMVYYHH